MGFSGGGKRLMSFWLGNFLVGDVRRKEVSFVARSSVGASSRIVMYKGLIKRMRRRRLSCHLRITGLMAGRKGGGGGCVCVCGLRYGRLCRVCRRVNGVYLEYGYNRPQKGVEVFTVARRRLVARFATKFASEQVHAQDAAPIGESVEENNIT